MTDPIAERILVVGATGNQGGAVVESLLTCDASFDLYGLTRDAGSEAAARLERRGVEVVEGDLEDPESLRPVMDVVDGVFCVMNYWMTGYDRYVEQGHNCVDAAAAGDVEHFVFSGVGSHDQDTGLPHFDAANEVDEYIQQWDVPNTVVKPVFFFQNFEPQREEILDGTLAMPLEEDTPLQMVDIFDVGRYVARIFEEGDNCIGERYELAGDERTLEECAEIFSEVIGHEIEPYSMPYDQARAEMGEEFADMYRWFNEVGYDADIESLESTFGFEPNHLKEYATVAGWHDRDTPWEMPGWARHGR